MRNCDDEDEINEDMYVDVKISLQVVAVNPLVVTPSKIVQEKICVEFDVLVVPVVPIDIPSSSHTETETSSSAGYRDDRLKHMIEDQDKFIESGGADTLPDDLVDDFNVVKLKKKYIVSKLSTKLIYLNEKLEAKFGGEFLDEYEVSGSGLGFCSHPVEGVHTYVPSDAEKDAHEDEVILDDGSRVVKIVDRFEEVLQTKGMKEYFVAGRRKESVFQSKSKRFL